MPVVAFTFGAFGDIVSLLQLSWSLRSLLAGVADSSEEIKIIIKDIDMFTNVLQQVKSTVEQQSVPPPTERALHYAFERCGTILRQVEAKARSFHAKIVDLNMAGKGRTGLQGMIKEFWARAGWEVFGTRSQVEDMRRRLSEQIQIIQAYLIILQTRAQQRIEDKSDRIINKFGDFEKVPMTVEHILSAVNNLPARLSYGTSFHFIDENGKVTLPAASLPLTEARQLVTSIDMNVDLSAMSPQAGSYEWQETEKSDSPGVLAYTIEGRFRFFFDPGSVSRRPLLLVSEIQHSHELILDPSASESMLPDSCLDLNACDCHQWGAPALSQDDYTLCSVSKTWKSKHTVISYFWNEVLRGLTED